MNKYKKCGRQLAQTVCDLLNLFYEDIKLEQMEEFKAGFEYYLQFVNFVDGKWEISQ